MKKLGLIIIILMAATSVALAQSYEALVQSGMEYVDKKDYKAAAALLEAALKKEPANPSNIMLMVNLAAMKRNIGELDEALILYDSAVSAHPQNSFFRHNRAALYCEMGRISDALKDYNTIIIADEKDYDAIYRRGLVYLDQKNLLGAEEDFERILKDMPENLKAKMGQAMILKYRGEWEKAIEVYSDLIYRYKKDGALYYHRAECFLNHDRLARTLEDLNQARSLGYDPIAVNILQGRLSLMQYDKKRAKQNFEKALELGADPKVITEFLERCK